MKIAVISVTENGNKISRRIAAGIGIACDRFAFSKHCDGSAVPFDDMKQMTAKCFGEYDGIIFICACGIAVRMIAPHVVSKLSDPAVVVIDESGKFAISLLSGHIGKANALTEKVAEIIGAEPVITTATDVGGKFSPDSFAAANDLYICEYDIAKEIAAETANGGNVGFYSDTGCLNTPPFCDNKRLGICISSDAAKMPFMESTAYFSPLSSGEARYLPISLSLAIISSGILAAVMKSLNLFAAASDEFIISRVTSVLILLLVMIEVIQANSTMNITLKTNIKAIILLIKLSLNVFFSFLNIINPVSCSFLPLSCGGMRPKTALCHCVIFIKKTSKTNCNIL